MAAAAAQIAAMGIACCLIKGHKDFTIQRNICSKFAKLMIIFHLSLLMELIFHFCINALIISSLGRPARPTIPNPPL